MNQRGGGSFGEMTFLQPGAEAPHPQATQYRLQTRASLGHHYTGRCGHCRAEPALTHPPCPQAGRIAGTSPALHVGDCCLICTGTQWGMRIIPISQKRQGTGLLGPPALPPAAGGAWTGPQRPRPLPFNFHVLLRHCKMANSAFTLCFKSFKSC